jgi:hypothetical protein
MRGIMLEKEYEKLVHCIEGVISDGCQIFMGRKLIRWEDTNIPKLLKDIQTKKKNVMKLKVKPGCLLKNRISGQTAAVINDNGKTVFMIPADCTIMYPSKKVWVHFQKVKKRHT